MEDGWLKDMRVLAASILTNERDVRKAVDAYTKKDIRIDNDIIRDFYYGRADEYTRIYVYDNNGKLNYAFDNGMESVVSEIPEQFRRDDRPVGHLETCSVLGNDQFEIMYRCIFSQSNLIVDGLKSTIIYGVFKPTINKNLMRILFAADANEEAAYSYGIVNDQYGGIIDNGEAKSTAKMVSIGSSVMGGSDIRVFSDHNIYMDIGLSVYYQLIVIVILSMALSYIISYLFARYVSRPIESMAESIRKAGDEDRIIHAIDVEDEIQQLSSAVDVMRSEIVLQRKKKHLAAMGEIVLHLSHDMRTPLSVISAYISTISKGRSNTDEYLGAVQRSVNKLQTMADELVDYAKATRVNLVKGRLDEIIRSSAALVMRENAVNEKVRFVIDVDENLCVKVDLQKIERTIINLVNNAVDAVLSIQGIVTLSARVERDVDIIIIVTDNGKGIAEEQLPLIFEKLFTFGKKHGTGLGLAYCKQVVEAHGGTIEVQSEVGKGTTFTIRIPNCVVSAAEARTYRNDPEIKCEGKKFVIIDDDADIRLRWRKIVEESGGKVVGEADSYEKVERGDGLDIAAADVAIVDYNYEGSQKTGIDVISYLKKKGLAEIHLCTGFAEDQAIRAAALAAGADSVIKKG